MIKRKSPFVIARDRFSQVQLARRAPAQHSVWLKLAEPFQGSVDDLAPGFGFTTFLNPLFLAPVTAESTFPPVL